MDEISDLVSSIRSIKSANVFKKYIEFVHFPYYRNLEVNTRINFSFPLVVFTGQNGCGKSSALHALYGSVKGQTPYDFWFDTKVDPLEYYDDEKRRHSFWYSYNDDEGVEREVVKARIRREDNPNYWETSRPLEWAGMRRVAGDGRDAPINKKAIYLDFRAELSAFDKFFYFGNLNNSKSKNKQEFIRRKSSSLKKLFNGETSVFYSSKRPLNERLKILSDSNLKDISFILGRSYTKGKIINHSLFRNQGYSVFFETKFAKYSEAFAGSGEMAIVRLVEEVSTAPEFSLILLDEPEVSLHPGAQRRLMYFLLNTIKRKKHQVILTSHSPTLIKDLPREAIKVFYQNPSNGRFLVKENMIAAEAFYHIEYPITSKINVTVEDRLAKEIILAVLAEMGTEVSNLFNIKLNPGGATVIKREFIAVYCRDKPSKEFVFFDGDQKPAVTHLDPDSLAQSLLSVNHLTSVIKEQTGEDIKFSVDGGKSGGDKAQQLKLLKQYLEYYHSNVFYLPMAIPEEIIWNEDKVLKLLRIQCGDDVEKYNDVSSQIRGETNVKRKFALVAKMTLGSDNSEDMFNCHKLFIQSWKMEANREFLCIQSVIHNMIQRE